MALLGSNVLDNDTACWSMIQPDSGIPPKFAVNLYHQALTAPPLEWMIPPVLRP